MHFSTGKDFYKMTDEINFDEVKMYDSNCAYQSNFRVLILICEQIMPRIRETITPELQEVMLDLLLQVNQTGRHLGGVVNPNASVHTDIRNNTK